MFKLSLLLKSYLQRTQTLQVNQNWKVYTKVIKTKQRGLALFRPRESNAEKRKRFNLEETEEMSVIKGKRQML